MNKNDTLPFDEEEEFNNLLKKIEDDKFYYNLPPLVDYHFGRYGNADAVYNVDKNDFRYDEEKKQIVFNIGNYYENDLEAMLNRLFIPINSMSFDLADYITSHEISLVLINNIHNLDDSFFLTIKKFFEDISICPEYKGKWRP